MYYDDEDRYNRDYDRDYGRANSTPFEIEEFKLVETGTFNDQYIRPYRSHLSEQVKDEFIEATRDESRLDNKTLAGIASRIISPTTEAGPRVDIRHGWGERRFMFHLRIRLGQHLAGGVFQYITGYTDHADTSFSGEIDPDMRLYFNNSVMVDVRERAGGRGGSRTVGRVKDASHIIVPVSTIGEDRHDRRYDSTELMAPKHVMGALMTDSADLPTRDMRVGLSAYNTVEKISRSRGVATAYLADAINGINKARLKLDAEEHFDSEFSGVVTDQQRLYSEASAQLREPGISNDPFMYWLEEKTNFINDRFITYGELCRKLEYLDALCRVWNIGGVHQESRVSERGESENWNTSNMETVVATAFCYSVPAMMMELMLTRAVIVATNENVDSRITVDVKNVHSFADGLDLSPYIERLTDRIVDELFVDLSHNGDVSLWVEMDIDVEYGTFITVHYDGGPGIEYTLPTFADALYSPIVTHRRQNLNEIASHVSFMADHIGTDKKDGRSGRGGNNNGNSTRSRRRI
jgi:hypothetical protein